MTFDPTFVGLWSEMQQTASPHCHAHWPLPSEGHRLPWAGHDLERKRGGAMTTQVDSHDPPQGLESKAWHCEHICTAADRTLVIDYAGMGGGLRTLRSCDYTLWLVSCNFLTTAEAVT